MTFPFFFFHFLFLSNLSSGLACVLCVASFSVLFFPILILSVVVANPIAKRTRERDASNRDRLYNPFAFVRVGRESIEYFPSENLLTRVIRSL